MTYVGKWFKGKRVFKVKADVEEAARYLKHHKIPHRIRKVKTGWKLDSKQ